MENAVPLIATMLFVGFVASCVASAALQLLAWWRHSLPGQGVALNAVWRPEGRFDPVGLLQMRLARRLLLVGIVMYLSYGVVMFAASRIDVAG